MSKPLDGMQIRIASPCEANWSEMSGDERMRHCSLCNLNVYNFGEMKSEEITSLLQRSEGRVCARIYQRADGTLLTRDCPRGLRALRLRATRFATALVAALLNFSPFAFAGQSCKKPQSNGSNAQIETKHQKGEKNATVGGVVVDENGAPMERVIVTLRKEGASRERSVVTDADGKFKLEWVSDGSYGITMTQRGFLPASSSVVVKAGDVVRAKVVMHEGEEVPHLMGEVVMGKVAVNPNPKPSWRVAL